MGDFSLALNEDQEQLRKWVHDFAEDVVRPAASEWDEREETPWPIIKAASEIGLYSYELLAQGIGDPTGLTLPIVMEELFWGDAGIGLSLMGTSLPVTAIFSQGTPEQIAEWIPACYGTPEDPAVGAFCVTETGAGSDVSSLRTKATYDEKKDEWKISGTKIFITNGGIARVHVVVASVDDELGTRGHAAFVVPPDTPGLSQGKKEKKMGIRASHTAEVILDSVRVPGSHVLGGREKLEERLARAREGKSSRSHAGMSTFEATRPFIAAQAVGIARAAYEFALDYSLERKQFGRVIAENQAIAFKLADMRIAVDVARLLVWRASWLAATGQKFEAGEGSVSKLVASETAVKVTEQAVQVLGGYGYIRDFPVERWYRDAKIYTLFEGTSEIQHLIIARALTGLRIE